ncbi:DUF4407 domain-containing protein [Chryseobacterium sp. HSC-36S06]|uniref:DUF4407 domain-containing protein n=1 Tax=Chryseobacterium sp. HSC-36S06 TaxID=2910970 RepID=UPI00209CADB6|nr:DUF4407 domain-containing protein [Chryseobacterium sp. HSC-36S06]MCP2038183.1 hypothetical protein [Chryseobacterium sp. HSC-36S06]
MARSVHKENKLLHLFSGEDRGIINELDDRRINRSFNFIGLSVIVICAICFVSAVIFTLNIFHGVGKIASLPIGLFWGFTVTTIYVLLLYTITPPLLIDKNMLIKRVKKSRRKRTQKKIDSKNQDNFNNWLTASMIIRLLFIGVFAVIVAQPINVILFSTSISAKLDLYKSYYKSEIILSADESKINKEIALYNDFLQEIHFNSLSETDSVIVAQKLNTMASKVNFDSNFLSQSKKIQSQIASASKTNKSREKIDKMIFDLNDLIEEELKSDNEYLSLNSESLDSPIALLNNLDTDFRKVVKTKEDNNSYTIDLIDNNNFYLRRIVLINSQVLGAWIINLLFILLFVIPIFLKFNIRKIKTKNNKESFYDFKKKYEKEIVINHYSNFTKNFEKCLGERLHRSYIRTRDRLQPHLAVLEVYKPSIAKEIKIELVSKYYPYVDITDGTLKKEFDFSNEDLFDLQERNRIKFYEKYLDPPFNLAKRDIVIKKIAGQQLIDAVWDDR